MTHQTILGIDLSGPANESDTAVVSANVKNGRLEFLGEHAGTDFEILAVASSLLNTSEVTVGIDAPLSYQPGGGQRKRDASLRKELIAAGLPSGSVMAPTFQRMAWLTLRGMGLASVLGQAGCRVVEVHPGGALALRGARIGDVRGFKSEPGCRGRLLRWLGGAGLKGISIADEGSSHAVAACAALLAVHSWLAGTPAWLAKAEPPWHPFDFVC